MQTSSQSCAWNNQRIEPEAQLIRLDDQLLRLFSQKRSQSIHAHGLQYPSHMEWTPDGRLLVSEFLGGKIKDITKGGDYRDAIPFAYHLGYPAGILTGYQGNRILVVDNGRGAILDVTKGGDAQKAPVIFEGIPGPYGLVVHDDVMYSTFSTPKENGLVKVTEGGRFSEDLILTRGFPSGVRETPDARMESVEVGDCGSWTAQNYNGRLLYLHSGLGEIFDLEHDDEKIRHHPKYSAQVPIIARGLNKPLGFIAHPTEHVLFVAERYGHSIKVIPQGACNLDMRYIPPIAVGFKEPSCIRFAPNGRDMYVCDFGGGCVWKMTIENS